MQNLLFAYRNNALVDDAAKAAVTDETNRFMSEVATAVQAQGGHVYFVGAWTENYENAVNE